MPSREVQGIIDYLVASGVPHRVTGTIGTWRSLEDPCSPHTPKSNHCAEATDGRGLAVDFGGRIAGTSAEAIRQMGAVFDAFRPVAPQLAELFHNGPGITKIVKNGVWQPGLSTLGAKTWLAHRNHVHVAVHKGTFLKWAGRAAPLIVDSPIKKVLPMWDPPLDLEPVVADLACPRGGAWTLHRDGGVASWGGAPSHGSPVGKDYWKDRQPARLEPVGDDQYIVVATNGQKYGPVF